MTQRSRRRTSRAPRSVREKVAPKDHVRVNRAFWESQSDAYDKRFSKVLGNRSAMSWGLWRIPESALAMLGPVEGRDILELGCGAARWSIALARIGARPIGLDLSERQLSHARRLLRSANVRVPLIQANAERVPFQDQTFDLVFCDWGAMTFCDPLRTVPECSRILRPEGILVFATASPIQMIAHDRKTDRTTRRLENDYFGMHRIDFPREVNFQIPYGEWIRLLFSNGFAVESLVETQPLPGRRSRYLRREESEWARHWPMECIWRVRKRAERTGSEI